MPGPLDKIVEKSVVARTAKGVKAGAKAFVEANKENYAPLGNYKLAQAEALKASHASYKQTGDISEALSAYAGAYGSTIKNNVEVLGETAKNMLTNPPTIKAGEALGKTLFK